MYPSALSRRAVSKPNPLLPRHKDEAIDHVGLPISLIIGTKKLGGPRPAPVVSL
jgi:hypothetical protein